MGPDSALNRQKGQALIELLLLGPLFVACILALLFFARILNARLTLIHVCRDMALALGRDPDADQPQTLLQKLVDQRGLGDLGRWSAQVQAALPGDAPAPAGIFGKILGSLAAERLTLTLQLPPARWLPGGYGTQPWTLTETVAFKRDTWKAPYAKVLKDFLQDH
jgi:hypothetical protein